MAGHSPSKDGRSSERSMPGHPRRVRLVCGPNHLPIGRHRDAKQRRHWTTWMAGTSPAMTDGAVIARPLRGALSIRPCLDHSQRRVDQDELPALVEDAVAGAHEPSVWSALGTARLDDLDLGVDGVAGDRRAFDLEIHFEEREAGMLHRGVHQQAFDESEHQRPRADPTLDVGLLLLKLEIGEQHFRHSGTGDEIDYIRFRDGAADRLERSPDRQIFEEKAKAERFHIQSFLVASIEPAHDEAQANSARPLEIATTLRLSAVVRKLATPSSIQISVRNVSPGYTGAVNRPASAFNLVGS